MTRQTLLQSVVAIALVLHSLLFVELPLGVQTVVILLLTGLLPGALLVEWLVGHSESPPEPWERMLYSVAAGYSIIVLTMLAVSYLPGGVARWQTLLAFDLVILVLLILVVRNDRPTFAAGEDGPNWPRPFQQVDRRWLLAGLLVLALVGGFFRFTNLGYAEFQGDEARAALRAAAVIQGYEDVLLIHKKGPTEILLPTTVYSLTGRLTEASARLPFAVANVAGLFTLFLLGWRLFGPVAGWSAAMLLALDGYFIGFSRIVQYQSIVFLNAVLTVLILYRLTQHPRALTRYLTLAAVILATGLLAHYEAGLAAIPALYLLFVLWRRGEPLARIGRALVAPLSAGTALLATFYVPFVLHPNFIATYVYLADRRIGGSFPYNNIADFFLRTTVYSTTYYLVALIVLATCALAYAYWRGLRGRRALPIIGVLTLGLLLTAWQPTWLTIGDADYTVAFFALALVVAWLMPRVTAEERTLWLWFGIPMLLTFFFTVKPRTHVYVFFMPWALLAGMVLQMGWTWSHESVGDRQALLAGVGVTAVALSLFGSYEYWYFVYNQVEILRTWHENRPAGYWTVYGEPDDKGIFGFPLRNGWKVVGTLYQEGVIDGIYATNEKEAWVPDWYTRGAVRCERDHVYYFFIDNLEPEDELERFRLHETLKNEYQLFGTVMVHGRPRMEIYKKTDEPIEPQTFDVNEFEARFDARYADPFFPILNPTVDPDIQNPLNYRLGENIRLEGYKLERTTVQPGDVLELTLYWRATGNVYERFKVFNQIIDPGVAMYGQRDGYSGCETLPTSKWNPGEIVVDAFRIPIYPDAELGTYPLLTGMYQPERDERLTVFDASGEPIGNSIELTQITIEPVQ